MHDRRRQNSDRVACAISAFAALAVLATAPASAADLLGTCCGDLEERIAELEATSVRTGSRKTTLAISGLVNRALLSWDDGQANDIYSVTNDNRTSVVIIEGESAKFGSGWSAGFYMEFGILGAGTGEVSQIDDKGSTGVVEVRDTSWWIENKHLGKISVGLTNASGLSGSVIEKDLSRTDKAAYSGVSDIGAGFFLRRSGVAGAQGLLPVTWGDVIDSLKEPDGEIVNYCTPELAGFIVSAFWGGDDFWNVSLGYEKEFGDLFEIGAGLAYNENREGEIAAVADHRTTAGSISVLHKPSGLNFTFAGGYRDFTERIVLNNGARGTPDSSDFHYLKAGLLKEVIALGDTAFYGEYARFNGILSRGADAETVEGLGGLNPGAACAAAGDACLVSGSEATVWGLGVVQHIDDAEAQLYLGYRHYDIDIGLLDVGGARVPSVPLSGFHTVLGGAIIEF